MSSFVRCGVSDSSIWRSHNSIFEDHTLIHDPISGKSITSIGCWNGGACGRRCREVRGRSLIAVRLIVRFRRKQIDVPVRIGHPCFGVRGPLELQVVSFDCPNLVWWMGPTVIKSLWRRKKGVVFAWGFLFERFFFGKVNDDRCNLKLAKHQG